MSSLAPTDRANDNELPQRARKRKTKDRGNTKASGQSKQCSQEQHDETLAKKTPKKEVCEGVSSTNTNTLEKADGPVSLKSKDVSQTSKQNIAGAKSEAAAAAATPKVKPTFGRRRSRRGAKQLQQASVGCEDDVMMKEDCGEPEVKDGSKIKGETKITTTNERETEELIVEATGNITSSKPGNCTKSRKEFEKPKSKFEERTMLDRNCEEQSKENKGMVDKYLPKTKWAFSCSQNIAAPCQQAGDSSVLKFCSQQMMTCGDWEDTESLQKTKDVVCVATTEKEMAKQAQTVAPLVEASQAACFQECFVKAAGHKMRSYSAQELAKEDIGTKFDRLSLSQEEPGDGADKVEFYCSSQPCQGRGGDRRKSSGCGSARDGHSSRCSDRFVHKNAGPSWDDELSHGAGSQGKKGEGRRKQRPSSSPRRLTTLVDLKKPLQKLLPLKKCAASQQSSQQSRRQPVTVDIHELCPQESSLQRLHQKLHDILCLPRCPQEPGYCSLPTSPTEVRSPRHSAGVGNRVSLTQGNLEECNHSNNANEASFLNEYILKWREGAQEACRDLQPQVQDDVFHMCGDGKDAVPVSRPKLETGELGHRPTAGEDGYLDVERESAAGTGSKLGEDCVSMEVDSGKDSAGLNMDGDMHMMQDVSDSQLMELLDMEESSRTLAEQQSSAAGNPADVRRRDQEVNTDPMVDDLPSGDARLLQIVNELGQISAVVQSIQMEFQTINAAVGGLPSFSKNHK